MLRDAINSLGAVWAAAALTPGACRHRLQCNDLSWLAQEVPAASLMIGIIQGAFTQLMHAPDTLGLARQHHGSNKRRRLPLSDAALGLMPNGFPPGTTVFFPSNEATSKLPAVLDLPVSLGTGRLHAYLLSAGDACSGAHLCVPAPLQTHLVCW
jgi:hypothetical protein